MIYNIQRIPIQFLGLAFSRQPGVFSRNLLVQIVMFRGNPLKGRRLNRYENLPGLVSVRYSLILRQMPLLRRGDGGRILR